MLALQSREQRRQFQRGRNTRSSCESIDLRILERSLLVSRERRQQKGRLSGQRDVVEFVGVRNELQLLGVVNQPSSLSSRIHQRPPVTSFTRFPTLVRHRKCVDRRLI